MKKFKETKIGKALTGKLVSNLLKSVPIIGDLASNVLDDINGSPKGEVATKELPVTLLRIGVLIVVLYMALSGRIGWDEAEQAKEFISD